MHRRSVILIRIGVEAIRTTMILAVLAALVVIMLGPLGSAAEPTVSFAHEVRPILSEHCFHCHGPDAEKREADLRLDQQASLVGTDQSAGLVIAGKPDESELFARISTTDEDLRMPPLEAGRSLTTKEIKLIRKWIEQGADWQLHWAFIPPKQSTSPKASNTDWVRNEIDQFVWARLEEHGLHPSPEADRQTLIRRVSLDLTGLPPTPEEVDRFLADDAPGAYERLVDRLLNSPRYGERMAVEWLDAARYADTYGYQDDGDLSMWRWRDWVIEAFNTNMPFDQFTIEQLAGDLLPNPTIEQLIATGFNRNHRHNSEGGAIPEEFRVEYVVDRLDTTATVWLGMTIVCARCHDHKYDPITQKEFYGLFAFFNNLREDGRGRKNGNTPPMMSAPTRKQQAQTKEIDKKLRFATDRLEAMESEIAAAQAAWEDSVDSGQLPTEDSITHDLMVHLALDGNAMLTNSKESEGTFQPGEAKYVSGPVSLAAALDGNQHIRFGDIGRFSSDDRFTFSAWIRPTAANGVILSKVEGEGDPKGDGYSILLRDGKLRIHLIAQWIDDAIRTETQTSIILDCWTHVAVVYDGSQLARGIKVYFNGESQPMDADFDSLFQGFDNDSPFRIGTAGDPTNTFHGSVDDVRIYGESLTSDEIALLAASKPASELLSIDTIDRNRNQSLKLRKFFVDHFASTEIREAYLYVDELRKAQIQHARSLSSVMIMEELPVRRTTHVLLRGQYDAHGETVSPDVPDVLPEFPDEFSRDRLGLARWLVDPAHPLTARVIVNQLWQMSFGQGLVKTTEDFGSQGDAPTHPQLLDWLATEFSHKGWDLKAIRRLIVTSNTFRQQSRVSSEMLEIDPENRLLARGPRFRLPAETIRDQALYAAGLLVERVGGPSVKPYQPAGLWEELSSDPYVRGSGEELYRRSLYTFCKRTVTHPMMGTFDSASREVCSVREGRTNTPLQALTLMNEEGLVEASRVLAERVMSEGGADPEQRLAYAFRLVTARTASPEELSILLNGFKQHLSHFREHSEQALKLASAGEYPRQKHLDPVESVSYTTVAGMLLNLDEVVTQH